MTEETITTKQYSMLEVSQHCFRHDAWIVVNGKVYNVTDFLDDHPGGEDVIVKAAGKDATYDFDGVGHSSLAWQLLEIRCIGILKPETGFHY
eukprot:jgi/Galph1/779/GphlegSOOS_G5572.1